LGLEQGLGSVSVDGFEQGDDLLPARFPTLSWRECDLATSVDAVYQWVEHDMVRATEWYRRAKRSKARWSRALRTATVVLATLGLSLPFVAAATDSIGAKWGYVVLLLAAATVVMDRFFGLSSARMRFAATETSILQARNELQFDWAAMSAKRGEHALDADEATTRLTRLREAAARLDALIASETAMWRQSRRQPRSRGMSAPGGARSRPISLKPMVTFRLPNPKGA
jgi:hypothetical protein